MPFGFSFGGGDIPTWTVEIYVGNALTQSQSIQSPTEMMMINFANMVSEIAQAPQPMKLICRGEKWIDVNAYETKKLPARVEFYNNRWDEEIK